MTGSQTNARPDAIVGDLSSFDGPDGLDENFLSGTPVFFTVAVCAVILVIARWWPLGREIWALRHGNKEQRRQAAQALEEVGDSVHFGALLTWHTLASSVDLSEQQANGGR